MWCHSLIKPQHDKTNKMTCPPSLISVFAVRMKKACVLSYWAHSVDYDHVRMRKLIWVFAGSKGHFVDFVVLRLNFTVWSHCSEKGMRNKMNDIIVTEYIYIINCLTMMQEVKCRKSQNQFWHTLMQWTSLINRWWIRDNAQILHITIQEAHILHHYDSGFNVAALFKRCSFLFLV